MPTLTCTLQTIILLLILTLNYTFCSLSATVTFTYKSDWNAPITPHHPDYQSQYSSSYQSQYRPEHHYIHLNFQISLDSEDDLCSGCWNISHYQQSFSGLLSPEQSNSIDICRLPLVETTLQSFLTKHSVKCCAWRHFFILGFPFRLLKKQGSRQLNGTLKNSGIQNCYLLLVVK